jgi:hypothetical protein
MNLGIIMHVNNLDELREYGVVSDTKKTDRHRAFQSVANGVPSIHYEIATKYPDEYTTVFEDSDGKFLITYCESRGKGIIITQVEEL